MVNKNSRCFAIWLYLSALYIFADGYLFYLFFIVKTTAVREIFITFEAHGSNCLRGRSLLGLYWMICDCESPLCVARVGQLL